MIPMQKFEAPLANAVFQFGKSKWSKELASIVEKHPTLLRFVFQLIVWQGPTE
jgi:hypothetical protein